MRLKLWVALGELQARHRHWWSAYSRRLAPGYGWASSIITIVCQSPIRRIHLQPVRNRTWLERRRFTSSCRKDPCATRSRNQRSICATSCWVRVWKSRPCACRWWSQLASGDFCGYQDFRLVRALAVQRKCLRHDSPRDLEIPDR